MRTFYIVFLSLFYIYQAINYSQHKGIRSKYNDAIMRAPFYFFITQKASRVFVFMYTLYSEGSEILLISDTSRVWHISIIYPTTPEEHLRVSKFFQFDLAFSLAFFQA